MAVEKGKSPEKITAKKIYDAGVARLLGSPFSGDAHRDYTIVREEGSTIVGINDWHAWGVVESSEDYKTPKKSFSSNKDKYERLLTDKTTVLQIKVSEAGGSKEEYILFDSQPKEPYHVASYMSDVLSELPQQPAGIIILDKEDTIIAEPDKDARLKTVYEHWTNRSKESPHPLPEE